MPQQNNRSIKIELRIKKEIKEERKSEVWKQKR